MTFFQRFEIRYSLVAISLIVIVFNILLAIFAPVIVPHDPNDVSLERKLMPSNSDYLLGTDHLGRCVMSRLIYGARVSLGAAFAVMSVTLSVSAVVGAVAGYIGGRLDAIIMRICDIFLAFPNLILALALVGVMGPGLPNVVLALALSQWAWYARMIRGMVLSLKERNYVLAAKVAGTRQATIIVKHILPNIFPQIAVLATLDVGWVILNIAGMSFLGLGIQPPTPEWGAMINDGRQFLRGYPSLMAYPGFMILSVVMSFNLLGDALRDMVDSKGKQ
ncbi:Nickel transport system permease protein NikC [Sporomusa silvacetica DSM 10669]|uniref:Nickel transport system permease protein NikC n=2 Tax=Sporomusa silvacetica TaxID=55504 RepID=A0ABZ3IIU5_9FIRM|nr:nickel ABC transporter permease subunit NikC [Sporomusa silvacetica]OZC18397.1 nickel transport system permease protein NikC [Sporomusa silvacetica DSM 10669]